MIAKPIKYVEVTVDKGASKETGLLLLYEEIGDVLRIILDNANSTAVFNLRLVTVTNIHIVDTYKSLDRVFTAGANSQKFAKELLCEIIDTLKKENKLNASGFVNIAAYKEVPDKYTVKALTHIPITHTPTYTAHKPATVFLATTPSYPAYNPPQKKIGLIVRKTELPSNKALAAMFKKAQAANTNLYKLKAKALSEEDIEPKAKDDEQEPFDIYGEYGDAYCGGIHGRMM